MYKLLVRPILFLIDPEKVHYLVFDLLKLVHKLPFAGALMRTMYLPRKKSLARELMGITFRNPVGLAAGFDKDARLIDELADLGFGFVEIGTLTPKPQLGNDKPRLFRLPKDKALINRMGFNNAGVHAAVDKLRRRKSNVIVGGNIGKNKMTPNERAADDYVISFEALYPVVDYFVVNVSSPNTPGLRDLQEKEPLRKLLNQLKALTNAKPRPKPILLKIAPDLTTGQLDDVITILKETGTDGIVATNTTISRDGLQASPEALTEIGAGGLSGRPLTKRSTEVIAYLREKLGPEFPIIAVGGIMRPQDAWDKIRAGADLVQIYTGFVYEGPGFVKRICRYLATQQR